MKSRRESKVLTAVVGSYPKPRYVYRQNGRSLLDSFGFAFDRRRQELGPAEFSRLLDRAALEAIKDQDRAGIDIVTDGEERRGHYVLHIVNRLEGVDARIRKLRKPGDCRRSNSALQDWRTARHLSCIFAAATPTSRWSAKASATRRIRIITAIS